MLRENNVDRIDGRAFESFYICSARASRVYIIRKNLKAHGQLVDKLKLLSTRFTYRRFIGTYGKNSD